jgi:hypothetical protein
LQIPLIYLRIDNTLSPSETLWGLIISVKDKSFQEVCCELQAAALQIVMPLKQIDLSQYDENPPWQKN